jgi:hypothetical protein
MPIKVMRRQCRERFLSFGIILEFCGKMNLNFGNARFVTTIHGNLSLLVCESQTEGNKFYLYRINKRGRPGTNTAYYECKRCKELGAEKSRVTVRHGIIITNPDAGHHEFCAPLTEAEVEALRIHRETIQAAKDGKRPIQAHREARAKIRREFPGNYALQEQIVGALPDYSSMRSSLY